MPEPEKNDATATAAAPTTPATTPPAPAAGAPPASPAAPDAAPATAAPAAAPLPATGPVKCVCIGHAFYAPGTRVYRWGLYWTVREDGRTMECDVAAGLVQSGIDAGRYLPEGYDLGEAALAYWRTQYRELFGLPPQGATAKSVGAMQAAIDVELKRLEGVGGVDSHLRAQ